MNKELLVRAIAALGNPDYPHFSVRLPENEWTELFEKIAESCRKNDAKALTACASKYKERALSLKPGDAISFGHYFMPSECDPNPDHILSPIMWRVLEKDGSKLRLISEDCLFWNGFGVEVWKNSSMRECLNKQKFQEWFTPEEQNMVVLTQVVTPPNPVFAEEGETAQYTYDRVVLLSVEEAALCFADGAPEHILENIIGEERLPLQEKRGKAVWIDASIVSQNKAEVFLEPVGCSWWLRTRGYGYRAAVVDYSGEYIDLYGEGGDEFGVRPVIWIDLDRLPSIGG